LVISQYRRIIIGFFDGLFEMSGTYEINGQLVTLTDAEERALMRQLIRHTRFNIWNHISSPFCHSYRNWSWHYSQRSNPIHWIIEAAGGANLASATFANRVKRRHDRLDRSISPTGILYFYQNLNSCQSDMVSFRRSMRRYLRSFNAGGGRTIRALTITRDVSFMTLQVCAALVSGGATAGASAGLAAAGGASAALVRTAATGFVINEMRNSSTRLGRTLAGETITTQETLREIGGTALSSVSDAMLGQIIGRFLGPLKDQLRTAALREIQGGRLASGVAIEATNSQIDAAITQTINNLPPRDLRSALRDTPQASSERECARSTSRHLMANRNFRRQLERNLQDSAR
jgi:hypothetical protein